MARKIRDSALESRSARLKLAPRWKPYPGPSLARGISQQYRRNKTAAGSWVMKASDGHGAYWTKVIGIADDFEAANGETILDFHQAQDRARTLGRGSTNATESTAPITVDGALKDYRVDLKTRGADVYNSEHPRAHLTAALLAKPVQLLTAVELKKWRNSLLGKISAATINRLGNGLCAALELAAKHDRRIQNRDAWAVGLAGLPNAHRARNMVLSDQNVSRLIAAAYKADACLGLLCDTLAVTGARPSQAVRLRVEDLHAHATRPKLMMPKSAKGRNGIAKKSEHFSVPITPQLAARLKAAAKGRDGSAPLLLQNDGTSWPDNPSYAYREQIREIVKAVGLNPETVTVYALRHASIVRMLLANVAIRLVASLHNTSVEMIEKNYTKFITEHADADDHVRAALLDCEEMPIVDNVVTMKR
jgi:integrase